MPLIQHAERLSLAMLYGMPGFVQEAALVAFADYDATTAAMRDAYRERRDLVVAALADTPASKC